MFCKRGSVLVFVVIGLVSVALLVGVIPHLAGAQKKPIVVTVVQQQDTTAVDPTARTQVETNVVNAQHAEPLIMNTDDMQLEGLIAESWKVSDDMKSVTFRLRKGIKFHDGSEVTAEDVKFTFERIVDPKFKSTMAYTLSNMERVEALDRYTVVVHLKSPSLVFLKEVTHAGGIVPKRVVEKMGDKAFAEGPVCSGPFKFVEWVKDSRVTFDAFDGYWGGRPQIDRLVIRVIPESSTRVAALLAGEVDVISGITPDQIKSVKNSKNAHIEGAGGLFLNFLLFNTNKPPFDNLKVRQAVNYATDVDAIITHVFQGYAKRLRGVLGDKFYGYDPNSWVYPHDANKAKQLLSEAGYPNGIDVNLEFPIGGGVTGLKEDLAQVLQAQLAEANIRVTLKPRDEIQYAESIGRRPDIEHFSIGRTRDAIGDPTTTLKIYFDRDVRAFYYKDAELEKMIREQGTIRDEKTRLAMLRKLNTYAVEKAVWGFLVCPDILYGVSNRIDWKPRADRNMFFFRSKVN